MSTFMISGMSVAHREKGSSVFDAGVWNLKFDKEKKVMIFDYKFDWK